MLSLLIALALGPQYTENFQPGMDFDTSQGVYVCQPNNSFDVRRLLRTPDWQDRRALASRHGCRFSISRRPQGGWTILRVKSTCRIKYRDLGVQMCRQEAHDLLIQRRGEQRRALVVSLDQDYD